MSKTQWIGVDWGTSNMRAFIFGPDNEEVAILHSDKGMGSLQPEQFEPILVELIEPHLKDVVSPISVICCGMVGAKQGWVEASYANVPCEPHSVSSTLAVTSEDQRIEVQILAGLCQNSPADVMRGEETQIAGFLLDNPEFDGTICLPGTHTKWVQMSAGEIVSFRTFMSGELFALLSQNSVLKHSVEGGEAADEDFRDDAANWCETSFANAFDDALTSPQNFAAKLFNIRAEGLLNGLTPHEARGRLSGLILGLEFKAARPFWLGNQVALIGASQLNDLYGSAFDNQSVPHKAHLGDEMVKKGLISAFIKLEGQNGGAENE